MAPWWNPECVSSVKAKSTALNDYKRTRTLSHYLNYKRHRGICKRVIKQSKRASWQALCSKFNSRSNISQVWNLIKAIDGRSFKDRPTIPPLICNDNTFVSDYNKSNILGLQFQTVSSSANYTLNFLLIKQK